MDSPVCLRLHWIKAVPVFIRIHELKWPIASVTGLAQVSFDGLRATDVLAHFDGMDSPVCLRLHWIKALPVFSRIHELRCPIASVTGLAQVSFDGLRATDVLASLMAWTRQYAFACTGSRQCLLSVASMSYASRARER